MTLAIFLRSKPEEDPGIGITERHIAKLRERAPWLTVYVPREPDGSDLLKQGIHAEIVMVFDPEPSFLYYCERDRALRWIHNVLSGSDHILSNAYLRSCSGLRVTNSRGIHGKPMADHVMGAILYFTRGFHIFRKNQQAQLWNRFVPGETEGKVLGIIGMGQIGRVLAQRAKAFGMTVLGVKRTPEEIPYVDNMYSPEQMDELLRRSDYVVLLTPYSPETQHLMNAERFAQMKRTAIFLNVGRGKCCDSSALACALRDGVIAGALVDACEPEPMSEEDPLWRMDNVLVTPHVAATSPAYMDRMLELFLENAQAFHNGKPLLTPIFFS